MKSKILLDIIDERIDAIACNDFHFIPGIIISCAQMGRLNHLRNHSRVIDAYFRSSPEVFDIVKDYRPMRLLKFLERVVRFRAQDNKVSRFTSANTARLSIKTSTVAQTLVETSSRKAVGYEEFDTVQF